MAAEDGPTEYPVITELQQNPQRFSFYQAVHLLESYASTETQTSVGMKGPCREESVRFRPYASLGFSSADVKKVTPLEGADEDGIRYRVEITFLGLYGTVSPLPAFYTEEIVSDLEGESNRRDFLDVFHHRAISLHYRILGKYRLPEKLRPGLTDQVSNWLFALIGLHNVAQLDKPPLKHLHRLLANLGLLATQNRSAAMVSNIMSFYFDALPVRVEEYVRRQVKISPPQQIRLGRDQSVLGRNMTLGRRLPDRAGKFRLWIGPLSFERYCDFLPSSDEHQELIALTQYLLQDPLDFDLGLILSKDDVPKLKLSKQSPCTLGWSTWLGNPPRENKHIIVGRSVA